MRYEAPTTLDDAVGLLAAEQGVAKVLAGGTDLLVAIRSGRLEPDLVVDLKRIEEMTTVTPEDGGFRVGAAVPSVRLGQHEGLVAMWPGVVEAAGLIGSTQVQSRATLAGNLCNASPAADSVPAMVAAGAKASIVGPNGRRDVPVEDVPAGPGKLSLEKGEIVASILLPGKPERTGDAYLRFIPRTEMDIAVVGVGAVVTLGTDGTIEAARIVLGAVGPRVVVADKAAQALVGTKGDKAAMEALSQAVSAACTPIDDKRGTREYRIQVAGTLAKRTVAIALERAKG
ncbi:xanthine dehydrogenase family protein subunit M [Marivibrio halodurans]|uniref:Xanthine dehydrogenase family protein subunit M n=1 Tax=Marivibrio halodurans TaxID=2039722 RepID=A0A8J7S1F5_9PROT|nr:xanthine dehydrogenase family protein subunit M [Marivibrio halodurans]MBP5856858.1 xanthine dehydrogenase family protein subunit M [Marivibrio halodurans]